MYISRLVIIIGLYADAVISFRQRFSLFVLALVDSDEIKIVAVQDCGLIINRLTCESQLNGGAIMGLGYALLEERIMDPETGKMINPNLEDYKVPGAMEIPEIKSIIFDTDRKVTGIGEPATIPTAGAIANAVYNAIGVRIRDLPITPDKVLNALAEKGKA